MAEFEQAIQTYNRLEAIGIGIKKVGSAIRVATGAGGAITSIEARIETKISNRKKEDPLPNVIATDNSRFWGGLSAIVVGTPIGLIVEFAGETLEKVGTARRLITEARNETIENAWVDIYKYEREEE